MNTRVCPIRPEDLDQTPVDTRVPDFVIVALNQLIKEKYILWMAYFAQSTILDLIVTKSRDCGPECTKDMIFKNWWLEEALELYRAVGWKITYEAGHPGKNWGEYYPAVYAFESPNKIP
jgi:hypothetical protein